MIVKHVHTFFLPKVMNSDFLLVKNAQEIIDTTIP
jgi:hypothetical protein